MIAKTAREAELRAREAHAEHQPVAEIATGLQIQGLKSAKREEEPVARPVTVRPPTADHSLSGWASRPMMGRR
jgi:hypothetical protein